jgi:hypothetical protein
VSQVPCCASAARWKKRRRRSTVNDTPTFRVVLCKSHLLGLARFTFPIDPLPPFPCHIFLTSSCHLPSRGHTGLDDTIIPLSTLIHTRTRTLASVSCCFTLNSLATPSFRTFYKASIIPMPRRPEDYGHPADALPSTKIDHANMSGYQQQPPPPKHSASSYSSGNSDPFNNPHQLNYDPNAQYSTGPNPYANTPGGPNPGAGGAGVAPPGAAGQYAPYYDNQPEMENRYEGGGMGRETWASESGWSANGGSLFHRYLALLRLC